MGRRRDKNPRPLEPWGSRPIYQDLALFDNLGPAANLYVGRELTSPRWLGPLGVLPQETNEDQHLEVDRQAPGDDTRSDHPSA